MLFRSVPAEQQSFTRPRERENTYAFNKQDLVVVVFPTYAGKLPNKILPDVKEKLVENFGAKCTEMEGAAIAHVAYLNKVSCVIIRAISDKADNSATMDYPTFEKKAIEHSTRLMRNLLPRI